MENLGKISLQFVLLNTYYSETACKMSYTPKFCNFVVLTKKYKTLCSATKVQTYFCVVIKGLKNVNTL